MQKLLIETAVLKERLNEHERRWKIVTGDTGPINQRAILHDLISKHFNDEEIAQLAFDLNVDYDDLAGNKSTKVRQLIAYMQRRDRLYQLIHHCQQARPNVNWFDLQ